MKNRDGFTLAELVLSVFIFSFIAASLGTIVSTTNRHMFQNYRTNIIKTNVLISMKSIQNNLSVATRVDLPLPSTSGQVLAFARNVDQNTGCYPIVAGAQASWHYFCLESGKLYYHWDTINTGGAIPCGSPSASIWNSAYAPGACASSTANGVLLMENVLPMLNGNTALFSRRPADGVNEVDTVRVWLRSQWTAVGAGFDLRGNQRPVDTALDTVIRFNRSQP